MKDITRVFQAWCKANCIEYHYGQRENLNLLNELKEEKIYFLHNQNRRRKNNTAFGVSKAITFTGDFFLVVRSDLDMPFFKELEQDNGANKYEDNIEPLLKYIDKLENFFNCNNEYTLTSIEILDVKDLLDFNADGLLINYTVNV